MTNSSLYSHVRNKHNIITVTKRDEIFTLYQSENVETNKSFYNYSAPLKNCIIDDSLVNTIMEELLAKYLKLDALNKELNIIPKDFYFNSSNFGLLKSLDKIKQKVLINRIKNNGYENNLFFFKLENSESIDFVFIKYLIFFKKVLPSNCLYNEALVFLISFREFINISGYDMTKKYLQYEVFINVNATEETYFSEINSPEFIPEFINSYLYVFLNMLNVNNISDDCLGKIKGIAINFCNWLFINNYTKFKIIPIEQ